MLIRAPILSAQVFPQQSRVAVKDGRSRQHCWEEYGMTLSLHLPFQRRRTTWDRLRDSVLTRDELARVVQEARRLGQELPDPIHLREVIRDPAELAHRAQPLVDRMAAVGQAGLGRWGSPLTKPKPTPKDRILQSGVPLWLALGIGIGAFLIGFGLGQGAAASRRPAVRQEDIEAAAEQIKERWPSVHDDDIREANGDLKRLSSTIRERTGESTRSVRERLTAMTTGQSANGQS
jgi:uncharacterized protein YjbJ (UPF0337 family)